MAAFRSLEEVANATPKDYLKHSPKEPERIAYKLISMANQSFPIHVPESQGMDVNPVSTGYKFLYAGPGSGLIISTLIQEGHLAHGVETSRRGIASAPENFRNYVIWTKPWETSFPDKYFHVTLLSSYLHDILTPDEWEATVTEFKRISKKLLKHAS